MREKSLQHLKLYLYLDSITLFAIIKDFFNHLEDIFINLYSKNHTIENFQEFKINISLFNDFYLEFISLASDLEYIFKMLI